MRQSVKPTALSAAELKRQIPDLASVAGDLYGVEFRNGVARCIFSQNHRHGDRDPSLRHDGKKDRLFCASQGCFGEKGVDAIGLVQRMDSCSFREALQKLADHYGIKNGGWSRGSSRAENDQRQHLVPAESVRLGLSRRGFRVVAEFAYGTHLRKVRFEHESSRQEGKDRASKEFRWEHLVDGAWYSGDGGLPKPLYVNRAFRERDQMGLAVGFEGEAKADLAWELGFPAFSFKGVTPEQAATLIDCDVVLWPDNDESGDKQVNVAAGVIADAGQARTIKVLTLPADFPPAGDIADAVTELKWDRARVAEFVQTAVAPRIRRASECTPPDRSPVEQDQDFDDLDSIPVQSNWPDDLKPEAFHGVAGELVHLIEPHSEADPAALLVQLLVGFGSVIGRQPHFLAEADKHFTNLFAVIVGQTAKGRKGTSWGQTQRILASVDATWSNDRIMGGLASGEGLIWAVRDEIRERSPVREKGRIVRYEEAVSDAGEDDKRLLVIEPEFARVLQVAERESNTLSAIIRQAWDTGNLRILTKRQAARSTDAHISIIGHVTKDELRRLLTDTAVGNGFANRFLWVCARRSKLLPEGGELQTVDFEPIVRRFQSATQFARGVGALRRDDKARAIWFDVYASLSEGKPGMLGAVTSRAEAQVMRIASLYALLDASATIRAEHLLAALAVWQYCEDSARFIFGGALGDATADEILRELRNHPQGMGRAEIRDHFNRNKPAAELGRALGVLQEYGLARMVRSRELEGQTRPTERWFAVIAGRG